MIGSTEDEKTLSELLRAYVPQEPGKVSGRDVRRQHEARRRLKSGLGVSTAVAASVLSVAVVPALLDMYNGGDDGNGELVAATDPTRLPVPSVIGMSIEQAQETLNDAGLSSRVSGTRSGVDDAQIVVSQSPLPMAWTSDKISVAINAGSASDPAAILVVSNETERKIVITSGENAPRVVKPGGLLPVLSRGSCSGETTAQTTEGEGLGSYSGPCDGRMWRIRDETSFPVNENGQTYGNDSAGPVDPDLVAVYVREGVNGYVYQNELSPEDPFAVVPTLTAYELDGVTPVGEFVLGSPSR